MVNTDIGKRLKVLRAILDLNQIQFGQMADIAQSRLSMIEGGLGEPKDEEIQKIETALGVQISSRQACLESVSRLMP